MKRQTNIILSLIFIAGCAKVEVQKVQSKTQTAPDRLEVDQQLSRTDSTYYDTPPEILNNYESLPSEIKTKTGVLQLGKTEFSKVNYLYNSNSLILKIDGHLKIRDQSKNTLSDLDFELYGNHKPDQAVIQLSQKNRQKGDPVIRAKVTCLDIDSNENFICKKSIVDFFVLYQKQFYTDQFESQTEVKKTKAMSPEHTPVTEQNIEQNNLQSEGDEDSLEGRYQGQVYTTNLEDFFKPEPAALPTTAHSDQKNEKQPVTSSDQSAIVTSNDKIKKGPPTEKIITSDYLQTANGSIRATNQAVGFPDNGRLRNATSILEVSKLDQAQKMFAVAFPKRERFYGTYEMSQMILSLGRFISKESDAFRLFVGNISAKNGGLLKPHKSHQSGMDVDIAYPAKTAADAEKNHFPVVVQQSTRKMNSSLYSTKKTFELFKHAFKQTDTPVDRIFVDRLIIQELCMYAIQNNEFKGKDKALVEKLFQNIEHVDGHGDHFHLRLKCTDAHPACRSKIYVKAKGCMPS